MGWWTLYTAVRMVGGGGRGLCSHTAWGTVMGSLWEDLRVIS